MRIRNIRRRKRRTTESGWGRSARRATRPWLVALVVTLAVAAMTAGLLITGAGKRDAMTRTPEIVDELRDGLESAEAVARAFLAETNPGIRLQWVRNADEVKTRVAEYPDEARLAVGEIESVLGHQLEGGRSVSAFVVAFPTGGVRLMELVRTPDGPRVDWDAYARYGTASWEDLLSGDAKRAVVRVFCEPSTERPEPFDDPRKWTGFRLSSPDLPQPALGFAQAGQIREMMMKRVVLGSPKYRQRFTLEILRHEGKDEPLFEITRCLAVGWITDERAVEEAWEADP
jgi:hypothetical protein